MLARESTVGERQLDHQLTDLRARVASIGGQIDREIPENAVSAFKRQRVELPDGTYGYRVVRQEWEKILTALRVVKRQAAKADVRFTGTISSAAVGSRRQPAALDASPIASVRERIPAAGGIVTQLVNRSRPGPPKADPGEMVLQTSGGNILACAKVEASRHLGTHWARSRSWPGASSPLSAVGI